MSFWKGLCRILLPGMNNQCAKAAGIKVAGRGDSWAEPPHLGSGVVEGLLLLLFIYFKPN